MDSPVPSTVHLEEGARARPVFSSQYSKAEEATVYMLSFHFFQYGDCDISPFFLSPFLGSVIEILNVLLAKIHFFLRNTELSESLRLERKEEDILLYSIF